MGFASFYSDSLDRFNEDSYNSAKEIVGDKNFTESYPDMAENLRRDMQKMRKMYEEIRQMLDYASDPSVDVAYEVKNLRRTNVELRNTNLMLRTTMVQYEQKVRKLKSLLEESENDLSQKCKDLKKARNELLMISERNTELEEQIKNYM